MQAKLQTSELAYLLHAVSAQSVVGLDDALFFPTDEVARSTVLADGFAALQRNGWLVSAGSGLHTNTNMMLLAAVLAAPEWVLVVDRIVPGMGHQILTYSMAQEFLVEKFRAENGDYVLTRLENQDTLLSRLYDAFQVLDTHSIVDPVQLDAVVFGTMLKESAEWTVRSWKELLPVHIQYLADQLTPLRRHGQIRMLVFEKGQYMINNELLILRDSQGELWSMGEDRIGELTLTPITLDRMARLIHTFLSDENGS